MQTLNPWEESQILHLLDNVKRAQDRLTCKQIDAACTGSRLDRPAIREAEDRLDAAENEFRKFFGISPLDRDPNEDRG